MTRPLIVFDAWPRTPELVCDTETLSRLNALGRIVVAEDRPFSDGELGELIPEAAIIMGEIDLPAERLATAKKLKAVINVSGNFPSNVDYSYCQSIGVYDLSGGTAFATSVAESALAMAIDQARGISQHDREFRAGSEKWAHDGTKGTSFLFSGAPVGIIGYGELARSLRKMLVPFKNRVQVFDPWVAPYVVERDDCEPALLETVLRNRVIFVFAAPTTENQHFLGSKELDLIPQGAVFVLVSRAAVVDFDELIRRVDLGQFRAAVDVFPEEPMPLDHPVRHLDGMLLSGHRTGGMTEAFHEIGRLIVGDAELILKGLPPQLCRRGDASIAAKFSDPTKRAGPRRNHQSLNA